MSFLYHYSTMSKLLQPHIRQTATLSIRRWMSSKDIIQPSVTSSQDFLLQNIKSSTDTENVLQIVGSHHDIMNNRHVLQALRSLFDLHKSQNCSIPNYEVIRHHNFVKLCKRLKFQSRGISLNDTIEALKIVSFLGVRGNSTIIQVLLQLVRQSINDLSLPQIIFLDFIIRNMEKSPLVEALKIALPLVFESQLNLKMDRDNVIHLCELLNYASKKSLSDSSITLIIKSLELLTEDIDARTAKTIVWSLCNMRKPSPLQKYLLNHCYNTLAANINQFSFNEIRDILNHMGWKCKWNPEHYYHEEFVESCARYVITKDSDFDSGSWILNKLTILGHVNTGLIDYLGGIIVNNIKTLQDCHPSSFFGFVSGMANAQYKPVGWNYIREAIMEHRILNDKQLEPESHQWAERDTLELPWIRMVLHLTVLDIFCPNLIQRVFQEDFLKQFLSRDYNLLDHLQLLLLYQAVITLYPSYSGPLPPTDMIETAKAQNGNHVEEFPLQSALENGLGGTSYVRTKLLTKLGHFIDHLIVMRKGGYPVALNQIDTSTPAQVEDFEISSDSQIVLILCMSPNSYAINCQRIRAIPALVLRTLECLGYSVVPVSLKDWSSLPDYEKIPYLMQIIKNKCESVNDSKASFVH